MIHHFASVISKTSPYLSKNAPPPKKKKKKKKKPAVKRRHSYRHK